MLIELEISTKLCLWQCFSINITNLTNLLICWLHSFFISQLVLVIPWSVILFHAFVSYKLYKSTLPWSVNGFITCINACICCLHVVLYPIVDLDLYSWFGYFSIFSTSTMTLDMAKVFFNDRIRLFYFMCFRLTSSLNRDLQMSGKQLKVVIEKSIYLRCYHRGWKTLLLNESPVSFV